MMTGDEKLEILRKMIAGLRDIAAKCDEKRTLEEPDADVFFQGQMRHGRSMPTRKVEVDAFSRDWISGRLLGMADMAEAFLRLTDA